MDDVGQDLQRSPSPIPLLRHSHPEHVAQDPIPLGSEYAHNLSAQPVLVFKPSHK